MGFHEKINLTTFAWESDFGLFVPHSYVAKIAFLGSYWPLALTI